MYDDTTNKMEHQTAGVDARPSYPNLDFDVEANFESAPLVGASVPSSNYSASVNYDSNVYSEHYDDQNVGYSALGAAPYAHYDDCGYLDDRAQLNGGGRRSTARRSRQAPTGGSTISCCDFGCPSSGGGGGGSCCGGSCCAKLLCVFLVLVVLVIVCVVAYYVFVQWFFYMCVGSFFGAIKKSAEDSRKANERARENNYEESRRRANEKAASSASTPSNTSADSNTNTQTSRPAAESSSGEVGGHLGDEHSLGSTASKLHDVVTDSQDTSIATDGVFGGGKIEPSVEDDDDGEVEKSKQVQRTVSIPPWNGDGVDSSIYMDRIRSKIFYRSWSDEARCRDELDAVMRSNQAMALSGRRYVVYEEVNVVTRNKREIVMRYGNPVVIEDAYAMELWDTKPRAVIEIKVSDTEWVVDICKRYPEIRVKMPARGENDAENPWEDSHQLSSSVSSLQHEAEIYEKMTSESDGVAAVKNIPVYFGFDTGPNPFERLSFEPRQPAYAHRPQRNVMLKYGTLTGSEPLGIIKWKQVGEELPKTHKYLMKPGTISVAAIAHLASQVLTAIKGMHDKNLVWRNVSPSSILLKYDHDMLYHNVYQGVGDASIQGFADTKEVGAPIRILAPSELVARLGPGREVYAAPEEIRAACTSAQDAYPFSVYESYASKGYAFGGGEIVVKYMTAAQYFSLPAGARIVDETARATRILRRIDTCDSADELHSVKPAGEEKTANPKSDVYNLGVILLDLFCRGHTDEGEEPVLPYDETDKSVSLVGIGISDDEMDLLPAEMRRDDGWTISMKVQAFNNPESLKRRIAKCLKSRTDEFAAEFEKEDGLVREIYGYQRAANASERDSLFVRPATSLLNVLEKMLDANPESRASSEQAMYSMYYVRSHY